LELTGTREQKSEKHGLSHRAFQ